MLANSFKELRGDVETCIMKGYKKEANKEMEE